MVLAKRMDTVIAIIIAITSTTVNTIVIPAKALVVPEASTATTIKNINTSTVAAIGIPTAIIKARIKRSWIRYLFSFSNILVPSLYSAIV